MSDFHEVVPFGLAQHDAVATDRVSHAERRKRTRTTVHWPILFFRKHLAEGIESTTLNLSSGGFYCLSRTLFAVGESLFCTLRVRSHDPGGKERIWNLQCQVRVKRAEPASLEGLFGVACEIEDYQFTASRQAPQS